MSKQTTCSNLCIFTILLLSSITQTSLGQTGDNSFSPQTLISVSSQQQTQPILLMRRLNGVTESLFGLAVLNTNLQKLELHFTQCFNGKKPVLCKVSSTSLDLNAPPVRNRSDDIKGRILLAELTSGFSEHLAESFESQITNAIKRDRIQTKWTFQTTDEENDPLQSEIQTLLQQTGKIREDSGRVLKKLLAVLKNMKSIRRMR